MDLLSASGRDNGKKSKKRIIFTYLKYIMFEELQGPKDPPSKQVSVSVFLTEPIYGTSSGIRRMADSGHTLSKYHSKL